MKTAVIGSGTWGLALSQVLCDNFHEVTVYSLDEGLARELNTEHRATPVFGDHLFPQRLYATTDLEEAVKGKEALVLSVPTSALDSVLSNIAPYLEEDTILINTAKGFDREALLLPYAAINKAFPNRAHSPVSLVGPSHAEEVVVRKLTGICAASDDKEAAKLVQALFSNTYLRVYTCPDPIGAEVGSAVKNVIAIAAGMSDGLGIGGDNTKAALVTRGICEIVRYGVYKGAEKETFFGLTGVGDLIVTCFSIHSRNYRAGLQIGKADSAEEFLKNNKETVEGIFSCKVIAEEAKRMGIEMPLVEAVYDVLFGGQAPSLAVHSVMLRPLKEE
ncbi:MAG: NAD(P)-dependent glycerol-3-phosphate dehydrogenase [Clostridia bacterium]|nr:NAD(P)-dependent glycerol-3-phosphate dehydrogenase [Clostridia bacterium]